MSGNRSIESRVCAIARKKTPTDPGLLSVGIKREIKKRNNTFYHFRR